MKISANLGEGIVLEGEREAVNVLLDAIEDGEVSLTIDAKIAVDYDEMLKVIGEKWWEDATYVSENLGEIEVTEMVTGHIGNAAAKIMREAGVRGACNARFDGDALYAVLGNPELRALLSELCERIEDESEEGRF